MVARASATMHRPIWPKGWAAILRGELCRFCALPVTWGEGFTSRERAHAGCFERQEGKPPAHWPLRAREGHQQARERARGKGREPPARGQ